MEQENRVLKLLKHFFDCGLTPARNSHGKKRKMNEKKSVEQSNSSAPFFLKELKKSLRDTPSKNEQEEIVSQIISHLYNQIHVNRIRKHPGIFSLAFMLCSELFPRSTVFRKQITSQMNHFITKIIDAAIILSSSSRSSTSLCNKKTHKCNGSRSIGSFSSLPLNNLTFEEQDVNIQLVLSMLEKWKDLFQIKYPVLQAACSTLEQKGFVFPNAKVKEKQLKQEQKQQEEHEKRLYRLKYKQIVREKKLFEKDIKEQLHEMQQLFDLLVPKIEEHLEEKEKEEQKEHLFCSTPHITSPKQQQKTKKEDNEEDNEEEEEEEGIEWEDVIVLSDEEEQKEEMNMDEIVEAYGLGSASYELTVTIPTKIIEKSKENAILFQKLKDGILQLKKRYIPLVQDWHQVLTEMNNPHGTGYHSLELLQQVNSLTEQLDEILAKWKDLVQEKDEKQIDHPNTPAIIPSIASIPFEIFKKQKIDQ